MWNGSRFGPRGGMPFRGEPQGEMFEGRDGPMPGFRGREGMNMGPNMGAGLQNRPLMDMRRFDGPPDMMGRNMGPLGRGRDPPRDFFSPGNEPDHFQRRFDMEFRNNQQNAPGFMGQGRAPMEMGGRDMQGRNMRGSEDQFMDMRERDRLRMDMPGMNMSPMDIRRRFAMEAMDRNENLRERERPEMGMNDIDGFSMDMPSRERPAMDFERRGFVPPLNPRGRFESDMDFRKRIGSSEDFRERSPQMLRDNDGTPMRSARGRPDLSLDCRDPEKLMINPTLRDREFPDPDETPERFREEKSLSEDWHKCGVQGRESPSAMKNRDSSFPREVKERFLPARGGDGLLGEPPQFKERNRSPSQLPLGGAIAQNWDKKVPPEFPNRNPPHAFQKPPLLPLDPPLKTPSRDGDGKLWPRGRDEKPDSIIQNIRHPFIPEKSQSNQEPPFSLDHENFKGSKDMPQDQGPKKGLLPVPRERQDQDYRDIDYRTSSGRKFDYPLGDLQGPEKNLKETKFTPPERTNNSGSKDQDYRSAGVQDKVSNTIAVSGIPKTATMQQILDAFAVHDGAPVQGMKIKNVVPGYSYDTAYVEFLNLEDAVHFMESNQGSVKVGSKVALLKYIEPDKSGKKEQPPEPPPKAGPPIQDGLLPTPVLPKPPLVKEDVGVKPLAEPLSQGAWQRNSNLTPEAWQQQVDKQLQQQEAEKQSEEWAKERAARQNLQLADPVFKESKTMIIKNVLPTTTVETILKTLDPFAYLDERNVRLVKGKSPGSKCFCFVDMDSHEHVVRLVELLTKPRPVVVDGVRVYAEVAKPLKNQSYRKDFDKSSTSLLGYPPDVMEQQQQQQYLPQPAHTPMGPSSNRQDPVHGVGANPTLASTSLQSASIPQGVMFSDAAAVDHLVQPAQHDTAGVPGPALTAPTDGSEAYNYSSDAPDLSAFLYDATSGFYYDPQTTLYYDPNSRYFYNAQTQQYLYWDGTAKTYVPVDGSSLEGNVPAMQTCAPVEVAAEPVLVAPAAVPVADEMKTASEAAPERKEDEEAAPRSDKKEKEERPKSLAAFKIMKDMERWAKIQNRQKESVRSPSPVLKSGAEDKKASKAADAAFAVFERKGTIGEDLFKKPLAPLKKEEKSSKRSMGSLGLLAADYAAGSDEEEEEKHEVPSALPSTAKSQPQGDEKEDKLTDWKKMACLLCRRQFPNKDALIRHQQLSDLHKQNMEIHLKIKKSKRELEALENQEKEMTVKESSGQPEAKKRKQQNTWGNSSRDANKGSDRPGLGLETTERKKKEPVVWNYSTYKQAVRKAMFARFKELE